MFDIVVRNSEGLCEVHQFVCFTFHHKHRHFLINFPRMETNGHATELSVVSDVFITSKEMLFQILVKSVQCFYE